MSVTYPTAQRYVDIVTAVMGATLGINTIREVSYESKMKELEDSGDDDSTVAWLAQGIEKVSGSMVMGDPVQASALPAQAMADFVFTGTNPETGYVLTVTLHDCLFFGSNNKQKNKDMGGATVTFRAKTVTVASASGS